jgi:hypothetical protein
MQLHFLLYPWLLHIWCWFMCVRGIYELYLCAFAIKGKIKLCIHLGGAQLHFMNFWAKLYISCKFLCCHQTPKRGRLKEHFPSKWIFWCLLSTLELLTVCLIVKVYWLMTQCLSTPQKWKDRSFEDLDFWLCILGLRTIKRGCSMKSWGEIKSLTTYTPLQYGWENCAEILILGIFWAETLGLRAEDSGL